MVPRPLQVGASEQRHTMGNRQAGQPQMAPPTYAQVAQIPPHQAAPQQAAAHQAALHGPKETWCRQEITCDKWAEEVPQMAGAPQTAPRAQAPPITMSDLPPGPEVAGTSHLSDDLRRYVSLLVQQYVDK